MPDREEKWITTFPAHESFERARQQLFDLGIAFETVSPAPGFSAVGVSGIVLTSEDRGAWLDKGGGPMDCSGWVEFRPTGIGIPPPGEPPALEEDLFGRAAVMVLAPCMADPERIRIIAHISGDMSPVFPYLNSDMREGCYNRNGPTFTYRDGYRMVSLYPRRIAVAKADELVDAWRALEAIRIRVNRVWARRREIEPSDAMREKPPALEILKRLPRTNCRACGEMTCLAFAVRVRAGELPVSRCAPVFGGGEYSRLKDALSEIAAGF